MVLTFFYVFIIACLVLAILVLLTRSAEEVAKAKAIGNAATQELGELQHRHDCLRECFAELVTARDRTDICARLPRLLAVTYKFPYVWIDRVEDGLPQFAGGHNAQTGASGDPLELGSELSALVLSAGKGFIYQSRQHSGSAVARLPGQVGALLSVPLGNDNHHWGILHLADVKDHPLNQRQMESLRQVLALVNLVVTTELDTARLASAEAERRHLELVHGGVLLDLDGEGLISSVSPAFEEAFGYAETELVGSQLVALLEPPSTFSAWLAGQVPHGECLVRNKNGLAMPGMLSLHARSWGESPTYTALFRDLAPQRELLSALQQRQHELTLADEASRHFMTNINHALRTPLNGIVGMADLLAETELMNEQKEYLANLQDALLVLTENLDGLHELAFPMGCAQLAFDPRELLENLADLVAGRFRDQLLQVLLVFEADLPTRVTGPYARLRQTLLHLIGQMTRPSQSAILILSARNQIWNGKPCLCFGIRLEPKMWDRDQVESILAAEPAFGLNTAGFSENGFNFNLARQLSRLLMGELSFQDEPMAQQLILRVPFEQVEHDIEEAPPLFGLRVLVVETRPPVAGAILELLSQCGCRADHATSIEKALGMLRAADAGASPCHFVFIPFLEGFKQIIGQGQALSPTTRYLVYSAPNQRLEAMALLEEGASYCLSLPMKRKRLVELMLNLTRDAVVSTGKPGSFEPLPARRLLLVEDNLINQKLMRKVLNMLGLHCEVVDNGVEAVEAMARGPFDLILMDINLPLMDGLEATRRIRELGYNMPILAMTADLPQEVGYCERHRLDEIMTKPIRVRELATKLQHYLGPGGRKV